MHNIKIPSYRFEVYACIDYIEKANFSSQTLKTILLEMHKAFALESFSNKSVNISLWFAMLAKVYSLIESIPANHDISQQSYEALLQRLNDEVQMIGLTTTRVHEALVHLERTELFRPNNKYFQSLFKPLIATNLTQQTTYKTLEAANRFFRHQGLSFFEAKTKAYKEKVCHTVYSVPDHELTLALREKESGELMLSSQRALNLIHKVESQRNLNQSTTVRPRALQCFIRA